MRTLSSFLEYSFGRCSHADDEASSRDRGRVGH